MNKKLWFWFLIANLAGTFCFWLFYDTLINPKYQNVFIEIIGSLLTTFITTLLFVFKLLPSQDANEILTLQKSVNESLTETKKLQLAINNGFVETKKIVEHSKSHSDSFEILQSFQINSSLNIGSDETEEYFFTGGSGRYTRVVTLPKIAQNCRKLNKSASVKLQLIDPTDEDICSKYADFRKGLRDANNQAFWTIENVKCQLFATVVAVAVIKKNEPLVSFSVGLKSYFSTFRLDLSSKFAVVTFEDPHANGYLYPKNSFFYKDYREDFLTVMRNTRLLNLNNIPNIDYKVMDTLKIKTILESLEIGTGLNNQSFDMILKYYNNSEDGWTKLKSN